MTFTRAVPPRFIDDRKVVSLIKSSAQEAMDSLQGERRFVEPEHVITPELINLEEAAGEVLGEKPESLLAVVEALFDEEALAYLRGKCKNRYWLFFLLTHLETSTFPVDVLALARAHARAKAAILDRRYGFNWLTPADLIYSLKGLPPGFVFEMWETGRLLAHKDSVADGFGIILNPLLIDD